MVRAFDNEGPTTSPRFMSSLHHIIRITDATTSTLPTHPSHRQTLSPPPPPPHTHTMFSLSEESKVRHAPHRTILERFADPPPGAHRAHHRCLPRRHPLRLPASDPLHWLLPEPAQALPHPVRTPDSLLVRVPQLTHLQSLLPARIRAQPS
jgi:hypothetical protein